MKRTLYLLFSVLMLASMLLSACGAPATEAPVVPTAVPATAAPAAPKLNVGEVTDMGGINDKSFNALGWKGVTDAIDQLGVAGKYLESKDQSDYAKNIQQFMDEKADLIITVGFLLGVDTAKFAQDNPNTKFAIVDYSFPDCWPGAVVGKDCGADKEIANVRGLTFQTDGAGFLAGYVAAGMTKTGKVGTFGGIKLPTVTIFMKGYEAGVVYYNQKHNTKVEVVGWNTVNDDGVFVGNFNSQDDGRKTAESMMQEGVDIIMPVAGPVGLGSAAACKETGNCKIIGVDTDWYVSAPEYKEVILTSVMKKVDVAVSSAIKDTLDGKFTGGTAVFDLKNSGVDIAPFHDFDSAVPADLKKEVDQAKADLISGAITVDGVLAGAAPAPTAVPTAAPTPVPPVCAALADAPKAAAGELGSADKPIVITFVPSGDTGKITKAGTAIADCLSQMTGLTFKMEVGTSFGASIEAMGAEKAQVSFLNTFSVLLAEQKYGIVPALVAIRKYSTNDLDPDKALGGKLEPFYKGQFIASVASGIKSFADLKGKTFCFVDPNSTSGYIVPRIILKAKGIDPDVDFKATQNAGSHPNVAIAVYKGDCDAGVTYINVLTDTSANLVATYPDIADKVTVFAVTDQIPNDGMQFIKTLDPKLQKVIVEGMLAMAADPGGKAVLKSLYNYDAFQEVKPDFYNDFAAVLKAAGVDPAELVK